MTIENPLDNGLIYDINKFPPLQERTDRGVEGFLGAYLEKIYLRDYYPILEKRMQKLQVTDLARYRQIPQIIEKIFVPLIQENPDLGDVSLTGEIPRAQATRMHPDYWTHFEQLGEEMATNRDSKHPLVREFCRSGLGFPHDPDADITFRTATVEHISSLLKKKFNVDEQKVIREDGREKYVLFEENGIIVDIDSGPLLTKPDIILMFINIRDKDTGERIFHIDVGEFPKNVQAAVRDKRVVNTTAKHGCQADLSVVDDHLFYLIPPEARSIMYRADSIPVIIKTLEELVEVLPRGARIATSHPVESLIDFERLLPQFDSETTFNLQESFRRGFRDRDKIPQAILFFTIKEWILSFLYDRDQATQMFFDSGFHSLTKLKKLTPFHRDQILRSNAYAREMVEGAQVPVTRRDEAYLRRQRQMYLQDRNTLGNHNFKGVEDFIRGLVEIKVLPESVRTDVWAEFFDLFMVEQPLKIDIVGNATDLLGAQAAQITVGDKIFMLISHGNAPITKDDVEILAQQILGDLPPVPEGISPLTNAIMQMRAHATGGMKKAIYTWLDYKDKPKMTRKDLQARAEATNRVYSVANTLLILQTFSSGLTPKQLSEEYTRVRGRFRKLEFPDAFLELKKLGLVTLVRRMRTTMRKQETVPVDIYFPLPDGESIHDLVDLVPRNEETMSLAAFFLHRVQSLNQSGLMEKTVYDVSKMLHNLGISLEALESFADYDFERLTTNNVLTQDESRLANCFRETLRWYYALRYASGETVPYVFNLLFNSFEGKKMLDIVKIALTT